MGSEEKRHRGDDRCAEDDADDGYLLVGEQGGLAWT
jgi:hypothetical protein